MRLFFLLCMLPWVTWGALIEVVNPGGELNPGVDRVQISNPAVPGWESDGGQLINDRTDYGNGGWRLSLEDRQSVWQLTDHVISTGDAFSLRFDAAMFSGVLPGTNFVSDLTLIESGLRNGAFNEDVSGNDSRSFGETPEWFNAKSTNQLIEATRSGPATTLLDGTRNAVVSCQGLKQFGIDTGYTLSSGDVFRVSYQWRDAASWNDASDRVRVALYTTSDDTTNGTQSIIQSLDSDLSTLNSTYQTQFSLFDPIPVGLMGKRLFLYFEGIDGNGDNAGFCRLDNLVLQRGVSQEVVSQRDIIAELYVDNGGARDVVATRTYSFKTLAVAAWDHYHLAVPAGDLDAFSGMQLGIQFRSSETTNANFQSFDNVRLEVWPNNAPDGSFSNNWNGTPDQVWLGPGYWANRLHDWEVRSGRVNCILGGRDRRTVHRVGTTVRGNGADFQMQVRTGLHLGTLSGGARTGLLLGAGPNLDWRGSMLVHDGLGRDFGLFIGLRGDGAATIEDYSSGSLTALDTGLVPGGGFPADARIELNAVYAPTNGLYTLVLEAFDSGTNLLSSATATVSSDQVLGSFGLLSHKGGNDARFWFDDFSGTGDVFNPENDRHLAIHAAMYSLSRGVLKLNAQLSPIDLGSASPVVLETWDGTNWQQRASAAIDNTDNLSSYTALFRISDWDATVDADFRLGLTIEGTMYYWTGTIAKDPIDKEEITLALTTCQRITDGTVQNDGFDWSPARVWHPHTLAFTHLPMHQPDVFIACGDQIYEGQPTPENSNNDFNRQYDYLYKWYLWVLQARDMTRMMPTIAIPDDHDVYQGNLWGEGGVATGNQNEGGYEEPASWVKLVERTQTAHLPDADPYNPVQPAPPVEQGIGVYFTGMIYGGVGMAIIEDRKFKTGSSNFPPDLDQQFLLGDRQKDFLRSWTTDWAGQQVKLVVSQSPFGNLHTHANTGYGYGLNDRDSHGWPVHRRNEVWELLRRSRMFQVAGDQHLSTVAHHGILGPADAGYSFTAPAIANFFPRCWDPVHNAAGPTSTVNPYTGDFFFDGNGTLPSGEPNLTANDPAHVRMIAAANPLAYYRQSRGIEPSNLHDRGAGYGIVRIDKATRRITFESWPLHVNPLVPSTGSQFPGWPVTIAQTDNDGRAPTGYLPVVDTQWKKNAVVSVIREDNGELVYAMRVRGNLFRPPVYDNAVSYRVEVAYDDESVSETIPGQLAAGMGAPGINSFVAMQPGIIRGAKSTLRWDVEEPVSVLMDNGIGDVQAFTVDGVGYLDVAPTNNTVYTLTLNGTMMATASVRVFDDREVWNNIHFTPAELLDVLVGGEDADPDGDGFSNREEFHFQTDPRDGSDKPLFEGTVVDNQGGFYVTFDASYPLESEHCSLVIESSADFANWEPLPVNAVSEVARDDNPLSGTTRMVFQLNGAVQVNPVERRYYRARWAF